MYTLLNLNQKNIVAIQVFQNCFSNKIQVLIYIYALENYNIEINKNLLLFLI